MTRRRLFTVLLLFFCIVFITFVSPIGFFNVKKRIAKYKRVKLDESFPKGILAEKEMKNILALSEILVPKDLKLGLNIDFFRNHVNYKTLNSDGYLKEYRDGSKLLEEATKEFIDSNKNFFELSLSERDKILGLILWRYRADELVRPLLENMVVSERKLRFRQFVVKDIIRAFYESRAGWAVVGYSHYPGVPAADPREYTSPLKLN